MAWSDLTMAKVSGYVVDYLRLGLAPLSRISRGFSAEGLGAGDTIDIAVVPSTGSTTRTKVRATGYTIDDNAPTKKTITLEGSQYVSHQLNGEDVVALQRYPDANRMIGLQVARDLVGGIMDEFVEDVAAIVDPTSAGNKEWSGAGATFGKASVRAIHTAKARAGWNTRVPTGLVLNQTLYGELLDDETLINHNTWDAMSRDALAESRVRRLYSLDIFDVDDVHTGVTGDKVAGMHFLPDAVGVAFAPKAAAAEPGEGGLLDYQVYTDPETGIVLTYREIYDSNKDQRGYIWEVLKGFQVLNAAGVKWIIDTDLT